MEPEPRSPTATVEPPELTLIEPPRGDMRAGRQHAIGIALRTTLRRLLSVLSLVALDVTGVTLGLYTALVLRGLWYGASPPLWGALWRAETDWLPFILLITVLLFAQAGLYRHREARAGMGRIIASLTLVAVLALAFGVGIGHEFTTFGLAPTAIVTCTVFVALLRGSYEVVSGELLRRAGVRRRAVLVGPAADLVSLREKLGSARSGIDYEFLGTVTEDDVPDRLAATPISRPCSAGRSTS